MRVLIVENPRSGTGDTNLHEFARELGLHDVELTVRFLNANTDLARLLRDAAEFDCVVAAGGDGTVSAVAYALRDTGIPILVYPTGTANVLCWNLHLPTNPAALARMALAGHTLSIDLGEIDVPSPAGETIARHGFTLGAGTGFPAKLIETAKRLKGAFGEGAYILGALRHLMPPVAHFRLALDDTTMETDGIAVMVMNMSGLLYDFKIAHGSDPEDGLFEVVILETTSAAGLLPTVWAAVLDTMQNHPQRPGLKILRASRVRIEADPPLDLEYDGEVLPGTTPVTVRVLPGAATFIVPRVRAAGE